jgi:hypothetical protein
MIMPSLPAATDIQECRDRWSTQGLKKQATQRGWFANPQIVDPSLELDMGITKEQKGKRAKKKEAIRRRKKASSMFTKR